MALVSSRLIHLLYICALLPLMGCSASIKTKNNSLLASKSSIAVRFTKSSATFSEAAGTVSVAVGITTPVKEDIVVPYSVSGTATSGLDYSALSGTMTIPAGMPTGQIAITLIDDTTVEPSETLIISLGEPSKLVLGSPSTFTLTIKDNDSPDIYIDNLSVSESAGTATLTVTQSFTTTVDTTFTWATADGTAQAGVDYVPVASQTATIPAGSTSQTLTVTLIDDTLNEADETFQVSLSNAVNANIFNPSATVIITDDDPAASVVNVSSTQADGLYGLGTTIPIQVTFTQPVTVEGEPYLQLETGITDRYATYVSGSGTNTLTFNYVVGSSDESTHLDYISTTPFISFGGMILDAVEDANLTLPAPGMSGSLGANKVIAVDGIAPSIPTSVAGGNFVPSLTQTNTITWNASTDSGGGTLAKYEIAVGTTANGTNIRDWTDIGNVTSYQVTGLTLTDNTTYYASVRAVDNFGNTSWSQSSNAWKTDVSAPTQPGSFDDGTTTPSLTRSPVLSWSASTDVGSGLSAYEIAIGTTAGGTDILPWTSQGTVTSTMITGLSLAPATTYYASVRAVDAIGNYSTVAQGDGFTYFLPSGFNHQAYVKAANADSYDNFGFSVALSGDTAVIATKAEASNQSSITNGSTASSDDSLIGAGAAYVYTRSGTTWSQQAYLKPPNPAASSSFGTSISISGDTIVVSAPSEDSNQTTITNDSTAASNNLALDSGAAYVFVRTGSTWAQQAYIKAPNAQASDWFGASVGVSGDTLVVGASQEDSSQTTITNATTVSTDDGFSNSGAAYVFVRSGSTWALQAFLKAPNANANDVFGSSVAVAGDTVLVGAPAEASNQTTISNDTTASTNNSGAGSGAVYVFFRTGSTWDQQAYVKPPTIGSDAFGTSVSISGDTAVVGAPGEDSDQTTITNGTTGSSSDLANNAGAAYVFVRTGSTWAQEAYLKAPNAVANASFGTQVSISADRIVVGATGEASGQTTITNGTTASTDLSLNSSGAAYVFVRTGTTWAQQAYLKAPNAGAGDGFGKGVAVSGDTVLVSAPYEDSNQTTITNDIFGSSDNSLYDSGAAYIFKYKP